MLAFAYLLLQALLGETKDTATLAPLLGDSAPRYPVDDDARRLVLFTRWRYAHEVPPVVDPPYGEAAHHLVAGGYLVFDNVAELGEGGVILGHRPLVTFAIRVLVGKQAAVHEVFSQDLMQCVQVTFALRLEETPHQSHILFR